jgi:hypothetical protein
MNALEEQKEKAALWDAFTIYALKEGINLEAEVDYHDWWECFQLGYNIGKSYKLKVM